MKNKYICIHGHFYQPPRENPWTGEVETEESAAPDHDWNERIFRECYGANLETPIQNDKGKVLKTLNNYEHMSFNFGSTLLSWMERHHRDKYERIIAADAASRAQHAGHGNAIAQAFNHMILPLAGRREKLTQIRWGIADFKSRYGRNPEGMWLPETAVDEETLECLIAEGMRSLILSPVQAARVRPLDDSSAGWTDVNAGTLNTRRIYRWLSSVLPGRGIDLVFYHDLLSRAVAFERILDDGENFLRRALDAFSDDDEPELLLVANDGESYGHHHRFGNMALSYVFNRLLADVPGVRLVNLAQLTEIMPPRDEVAIHPRTAWSCAHGIGRWKEDCGCNSGAHPKWNQKWRKPLREALDWLAAALDSFYEDRAFRFFEDPWQVRDLYIGRLLNPSAEGGRKFLSLARRPLNEDESREALRLCEMQRYRMYMFTSDGWFFDEISGIEPVQIMKYAARALDLAVSLGISTHPGLEIGFLQRLANAISNVPHYGDGANVYRQLVQPLRIDLRRAVAHFALLDHLHLRPAANYDVFHVERSHAWRANVPPRGEASAGHIAIRHEMTQETLEETYVVWKSDPATMECRLRRGPASDAEALVPRLSEIFKHGETDEWRRLLGHEFDPVPLTPDALFPDDRRHAKEFFRDPQEASASPTR